ncbi:secreted protein [gut metagenome]|uniref:Secreted protein n=1 Tax=gut metagenome TaxID=749906 RepID=J9FPW2_9ZZZZ
MALLSTSVTLSWLLAAVASSAMVEPVTAPAALVNGAE